MKFPKLGSTSVRSAIAIPAPITQPPIICPNAVLGFRIFPQLATLSIRLMRKTPVSLSTHTSVKLAPKENTLCALYSSSGSAVPSASKVLNCAAFIKATAVVAAVSPTLSFKSFSACSHAARAPLANEAAPQEPPEPGVTGYSESPNSTSTCSTGISRYSETVCASMV